MHDGRAVGRFGLVALDELMSLELLPHRRANRSCTASVHDADGRETRESRLVDERADSLARLLRTLPAHVQLVPNVAARAREHSHPAVTAVTRVLSATAWVGAEPCDGDTDTEAAGAYYLGLLTLDRRDRPPDTEVRSLDRVAGCKRRTQRKLLERT